MPKPLLLLDIDGVLNALAPEREDDYHMIDADGFPPLAVPRHADASVQALMHHYTVLWSTLWQEDAPRFFAPAAGFGYTWGWIDFDAANDRLGGGLAHLPQAGGYKHAGWIETLGDDTPAVIIDDDFAPENRIWADARTKSGVPTLLLEPLPREGMTIEHSRAALNFAARLGATL